MVASLVEIKCHVFYLWITIVTIFCRNAIETFQERAINYAFVSCLNVYCRLVVQILSHGR